MSKRPMPDCYDYVRNAYGVPAYIGVRVNALGHDGVIVNAPPDQYVHVRLDGDTRAGIYHPSDLEYFVVGASLHKSTTAVTEAKL